MSSGSNFNYIFWQRILGQVTMDRTSESNIEELIAQKKWMNLRSLVTDWQAPEIADLLLSVQKSDRVLLFRVLPRTMSTEVFAHLNADLQVSLVKELTDEETRQLLENLEPDDRTHLFEELPGRVTQRMLNLLNPDDLIEARKLLGYPEESIGRLMTPDYVAVRAEWTVEKSLQHIRTVGVGLDTIAMIYVVDSHWKLLDAIELQQFVLATPTIPVESIMDRSFVSLSPYGDREEAVGLMGKYDLFAVPVVESEGILLGVVTVDDVMDVAEEEATEDFQKSAAVEPLKMSYEEAGVWSLYYKRIFWLAPLGFVNLAASSVVAAYETTLSSAIILVFFIPLLIGSGGNTGAQSATLMVRAIATGDIHLKQWLRTLTKELSVGLSLGTTMGLVAWIFGFFHGGTQIALVVGSSMLIIVIVANSIGAMLPLVLNRLGFDPAVASSPLITSIADVIGLLIYFWIAVSLLQGF